MTIEDIKTLESLFIVPEPDMLKVISTLKVLAKDHSVSPAILEELKQV